METAARLGGSAGMPRYHLNLRDGDKWIEDFDGSDLPSLEAAREEALASAREMLAEKIRDGNVVNGQMFVITDDRGTILATVPLRDALKLP